MKLRSYLFLLALVMVLPLLLLSGVLVVSVFFDHRTAVVKGLVDTSRALSLSVDRKLAASIDALAALASSDLLDAGDLARFRPEAERALGAHEAWSSIAVAEPSGRLVLDLGRPPGAPVGNGEAQHVADVWTARAPVVSDLVEGPRAGAATVYVAVPVIRDSRLRYALIAGLDPRALGGALATSQLPADRSAALMDRTQTVIGRSANGERFAGKPAAPELARQSRDVTEGSLSDVDLDGVPVYTGFERSPLSGWTVATSVPIATVDGPLWRRLLLLSLVGLGLIVLAMTGAVWFERRIRIPVVGLSRAAENLAHGGLTRPPPTSSIVEIDLLARSIAHADRLLRERAQGWERAEAELADQREQFRVTLASIGDAVIATDVFGRVTFMNDEARALTGWANEPTVGRSLDAVLALLDEESGAPIEGPFTRVMRDGLLAEAGRRTLLRSRGGQEIPVECRGAPRRDADGRTVGAVLVCRDASERRRAERERAEILARAHAARDEAEAANRAKDEFIAMLGHELRNPLGAISNALYVLDLVGAPAPPAAQARQVIGRGLEQLTRMVDDLLDAARITRGKIALDTKTVNLADVVTQSLSTLGAAGRTSRHQITVGVEPAWIDGDPVRVQQIVTNLIANAIKYTPADGAIHVEAGADGDDAVVRVRDAGIGISAEMLPRVFDLFAQGDRTLDRSPGGLGIGLTIARRLVEAHGGTIEAQSDGPGRGSVFTVRLPRVPPPLAVPVPATAPAAAPTRRILIVEDGQDGREMLRIYLTQLGHQVHEAVDGPAGIEAALRLNPDVALIDIGLPGVDGYEVARRIRAAPAGDAVFLVALTGYGQPQDRQRALGAGFDAFLVKPFDRDRLSTLLTVARHSA